MQCSIFLYSECSLIVVYRACTILWFPFQSVSYVFYVVSFLQDGRTPLLWAASKGHLEVVSLLLERGADKEARDTMDGVSTPCCGALVTNKWGSVRVRAHSPGRVRVAVRWLG